MSGAVEGSQKSQKNLHAHVSVPTDSATQSTLSTEGRTTKFTKGELTPPTWGERFCTGAKVAGLGLGVVVGGVFALGLFPFTIGGVLLVQQGNKEDSLSKILLGTAIAFPFYKSFEAVEEIKGSFKETDLTSLVELAKGRLEEEIGHKLNLDEYNQYAYREFSENITNLGGRDLQRLFNKVLKLEVNEGAEEKKRNFLNIIEQKIDERK